MTSGPFDAVLVISFGGPQGPADVRPFLEHVLRGRRVPAHRLEEVAHHYERFGGVSPITAFTRRQAAGLEERLAQAGRTLDVFVGMRNWHPFLTDTLREMSGAGVRRALGFITAAQQCYSSCGQYRQNVIDARAALRREGLADVEVSYVGSWHAHEAFVAANAAHVRQALGRLPASLRALARVIFTAHSIPTSMAERSRYREQLAESAGAVAARLSWSDWALVYQSRSGRPEDPWLGPDICEYLRAEHARGLRSAVISPIGFVCDHVEVLYDLDHEAGQVCRELGLPMARAEAVNDDPIFIDMMADVVLRTMARYAGGRPLPIVSVDGK